MVGGLTFGLATLYVDIRYPHPELEGVLPFVLAPIGMLVGAPAGCWLALRWARFGSAGTTSAVTALLFVGGLAAAMLLERPFPPGRIAGIALALASPLLARAAVVRTAGDEVSRG